MSIRLTVRSVIPQWGRAAAIPAVILAVAACVGFVQSEKPEYYARSVLLVSEKPPKAFFETREVRPDFASYFRQSKRMIKGRLVLESALSDPKLVPLKVGQGQADPVSWVASQIQVRDNGELIEIGMAGEDPKTLAAVVNAVTNAYLKGVVNDEFTERQIHLERLEKIYNDLQEQRKERRERVRKIGMSVRYDRAVPQSPMQQYQDESQASIRRQLHETEDEMRRYSCEMEVLKEARGRAETKEPGEQSKRDEATIDQLSRKLAVLSKLKEKLRREWDVEKKDKSLSTNNLMLGDIADKIAFTENAARVIGNEVEVLKIELINAPKRVRVLETAVPPTSRTRPGERPTLE